jgi:DNA repair photolyase
MSYIDLLRGLSKKSGFIPSILKDTCNCVYTDFFKAPQPDFTFPVFNIVNLHEDCRLCRYGFQIDVWQGYCPHGCVYCWAKWTGSASERSNIKPFDLLGFWYFFEKILGSSNITSLNDQVMQSPGLERDQLLIEELIKNRVPLRIGSFYDSFIREEMSYKLTASVIEILNFYDYPYLVVTKSSLPAEKPWIDILRSDLSVVQMSISVSDEEISRCMEPGAPTVADRFRALKAIGAKGIYTCIRINPMFPWQLKGDDEVQNEAQNSVSGQETVAAAAKDGTVKEGTVEDRVKKNGLSCEALSEQTEKPGIFSEPDVQLIQMARENNVKGVLVGMLNFNPEYSDRIFRALSKKWQLPKIYSSHGLDVKEADIRAYYSFFAEECQKKGIGFSTCYLGYPERHYSLFSDLWTHKECFCSVNLEGKENTLLKHSGRQRIIDSAGQFKKTAQEDRKKGFIEKKAEAAAKWIIDLIVRLAQKK